MRNTKNKKINVLEAADGLKDEDADDVDMAVKSQHNASQNARSAFTTLSKKLKVNNAGDGLKDEDDENVDMAIKSVHNAS